MITDELRRARARFEQLNLISNSNNGEGLIGIFAVSMKEDSMPKANIAIRCLYRDISWKQESFLRENLNLNLKVL
jgi:hypothetical protein